MATKESIIDLKKYQTPGSKVFTTRPRGKQVREASKIDILETQSDLVKVLIPKDIASINPSFLEEFLKNVVIKLGSEVFLKKIKFESVGRYNIEDDLTEAIERLLREQSAIE